MDNLHAVELIKSLLFVVEGSDEIYGLLDMMDGHYSGSPDMIDINKLIKEAKLFLKENG